MNVPRATPAEIYARVKAEIAANPSVRPYLGEAPSREACERGHPVNGAGRGRYCRPCREGANTATMEPAS